MFSVQQREGARDKREVKFPPPSSSPPPPPPKKKKMWVGGGGICFRQAVEGASKVLGYTLGYSDAGHLNVVICKKFRTRFILILTGVFGILLDTCSTCKLSLQLTDHKAITPAYLNILFQHLYVNGMFNLVAIQDLEDYSTIFVLAKNNNPDMSKITIKILGRYKMYIRALPLWPTRT